MSFLTIAFRVLWFRSTGTTAFMPARQLQVLIAPVMRVLINRISLLPIPSAYTSLFANCSEKSDRHNDILSLRSTVLVDSFSRWLSDSARPTLLRLLTCNKRYRLYAACNKSLTVKRMSIGRNVSSWISPDEKGSLRCASYLSYLFKDASKRR